MPSPLAEPALRLTHTAGTTTLAANDDWDVNIGSNLIGPDADAPTLARAFAQAGAFAFAPASKDAALLVDLTPGDYHIQLTGAAGASGLALLEIFGLTPPAVAAGALPASPPTGSVQSVSLGSSAGASDPAAPQPGNSISTITTTARGRATPNSNRWCSNVTRPSARRAST